MQQLIGRRIQAPHRGSIHHGTILGLTPKNLYQERKWRIKFDEDSKVTMCSAMQITQWVEPLDPSNPTAGREQFVGRSVTLKNLCGDPSPGIVIGVVPHSPHWSVVTIDDKWTCCSAQELLLWLDPLPPESAHAAKPTRPEPAPVSEALPELVDHDFSSDGSDESDDDSDSSDSESTQEDFLQPLVPSTSTTSTSPTAQVSISDNAESSPEPAADHDTSSEEPPGLYSAESSSEDTVSDDDSDDESSDSVDDPISPRTPIENGGAVLHVPPGSPTSTTQLGLPPPSPPLPATLTVAHEDSSESPSTTSPAAAVPPTPTSESNNEAANILAADNISGDLDKCEIRRSSIAGAGWGLFATTTIRPGQRVTKYSGRRVTSAPTPSSTGSYIVEVNSKLWLDADGPGHMAGRYINDGVISNRVINARLGSSRVAYICRATGRSWIPVIATRLIRPGDEILIDYGPLCTWSFPEAPASSLSSNSDTDSDGETSSDSKKVCPDVAARPALKRKGPQEGATPAPTKRSRPGPESSHSLADVERGTANEPLPKVKADPTEDTDADIEEKSKLKAAFEAEWDKTMAEKSEAYCKNNDSDLTNPFEVAAAWFENLCTSVSKAAELSLPKLRVGRMPTRKVSDVTSDLFGQRSATSRKLEACLSCPSRSTRSRKRKRRRARRLKQSARDITLRIKNSCFDDYRVWVEKCVLDIEKANAVGDTRRIYKIVKKLAGKPKPPPANLTKDAQGNLLQSPVATANTWYNFLKPKFAATEREAARPPMSPIPEYRGPNAELTRKEFEVALNSLDSGKATGPDNVPVEVFRNCPKIKSSLFNLLSYIWRHESPPDNLVSGKFVMLWKGSKKGPSDDPSTYRCICLLNHAYKVLSVIMLNRLLEKSESFLQDWQAGFRARRGCRDNTMILRSLCQRTLCMGEKLAAVFVDYSAAFDTVSHKFVDIYCTARIGRLK